MWGRSQYDNLAAAAICVTKRNVRLRGQPNRLEYHIRPVDWDAKFQPTLGSYEAFLRGRPDQFEVLAHPDGLGHTVKDVTGNETVAPTGRFILKPPATPKRRSISSRHTGNGVVTPILRLWKQAWAREESGERKPPAAGGRSGGVASVPESEPTASKEASHNGAPDARVRWWQRRVR